MSDLPSSTVMEQLRTARQHRGLQLRAVAEITDLPLRDLAALESSDFPVGSDVRLLASLRVYARYLDLDPEPMLQVVTPATTSLGPGEEVTIPLAPAAAAVGERSRQWRRIGFLIVLGLVLGIVLGIGAALAAGDIRVGENPELNADVGPHVVVGSDSSK